MTEWNGLSWKQYEANGVYRKVGPVDDGGCKNSILFCIGEW